MKENYIFDATERKRQIDRLSEMKDEDIDTTDPGARVLSEEQWSKAKPLREMFRPIKESVTLRIDAIPCAKSIPHHDSGI